MSTMPALEQDFHNEFDRIYPLEKSTVISLYKKDMFYGLLRNGEILTDPIYTSDVRIISDKYAVVHHFKTVPYYNNGAIIDLETGKEVVSGFNAFFNHKNVCIAFRENGENDRMRWGVFSLTENRQIIPPIISLTYLHGYLDNYVSSL